MNYKPHPDYANYMEANSHGFIDVWSENGVTQSKLYTNHEPTPEDLAATELRMKILLDYTLPEGMTIEENEIPGSEKGQLLTLRIYRPQECSRDVPILMNVHGGGWIGGCLDIDNSRAIALAEEANCLVVSVDYRVCRNGIHYPTPLMDCLTAYLWLRKHGDEIGGDTSKIAIHGTSAGGSLCAGMALYLRDHNLPLPALTVLNCPALYFDGAETNMSTYQYSPVQSSGYGVSAAPAYQYLGCMNGQAPSYYAFPGLCPDVSGLSPHFIVTAEYDWLRDDALRYGTRLLRAAVPCEMIFAPRVCHAFCAVDAELTKWVHQGIAMSLKREFA